MRGYSFVVDSVGATTRRLGFPLALGFGTLLILAVVATGVTLNRSFAIFRQVAAAHEDHFRVADALHRLRSDLYLAGIYKRDFLLDRNVGQSQNYGEEFNELQRSAEHNLRTIEQAVGQDSGAAVQRLRAEVAAYMRPLRESLDWEPVIAPSLRYLLLRAQLKQRSAALQIAAEIEKLNADALANQQQEIAAAESRFRRTLLLISFVGVLLGAAIAWFTILYTRRLEKHSDEVRSELRQLSQHVVKVQEHERRSISRELHDEVGQTLTGLRMELANLDGPSLQQNTVDYQRLQEAKRLSERALQSVRSLSMLLRPSMLDDLGLGPAVSWQAREFSRRSGVPVDVAVDGDVDDVPDEIRTCLYRVVQEALTNIARHAAATRIRLSLKRSADEVSVVVDDNGAGFDPSRPRTRGLGLVGMKERAAELSGTVDVASAPGKGTRISVRIPLVGVPA